MCGSRKIQDVRKACASTALYAEMLANHVIGERVDEAGGDAPTLFENAELAGDAPREGKFLFDQQHRDTRVAVESENHVSDLVHDVRLNPLGGLVQNEQRGFEH